MFNIQRVAFVIALFLPLLGSAQTTESASYDIAFEGAIPPDQYANGRCGVRIEVEGMKAFDAILQSPQYSTSFKLSPDQNTNRKVKIEGKSKWMPPNNAPACELEGELYLNHLILAEWEALKGKMTGTQMSCINAGVYFLGAKIDGPPEASALYLRTRDAKAKKVFDACDKIIAIDIRNNIACELGNGIGKSFCDEGYARVGDPSGAQIDFNTALQAAIKGEDVKKGIWENQSASKARLEKIAKQEQERVRLAKEQSDRAERERWLQTPEGKKFAADEEARRKAAEESRKKAEAESSARFAAEFPYYAIMTCGMREQHYNIDLCFSGRVGSEIELANGKDYGLYKDFDIRRLGKETRTGFTIDLRSNFELKAQNSNNTLILGIKIFRRGTDEITFQKQVAHWGVISVRN